MEMGKKLLILTVGLPRSGKSTWSNKQGFPIVNPDAIRLALHNEAFIGAAEQMIWVIAHYMVKSLFLAGHDTVILDATNLTEDRRKRWLSDGWTTKYKLFKANEVTCIKRALESKKPELVEIIRIMADDIDYDVAPLWRKGK
jgi:predicted kinase